MKKKVEVNQVQDTVEPKKKKRSKTSPIRILIGMILIAIMGVMILSIYKEIQVTLELQKDINEVNSEIATLNDTKNNLEKQKENFGNNEFIEQYARGKYKLTKEGETIYKLPGKTTTDNEEGE